LKPSYEFDSNEEQEPLALFTGGDGSSPEAPIRINTDETGARLGAEYDYVTDHCGARVKCWWFPRVRVWQICHIGCR